MYLRAISTPVLVRLSKWAGFRFASADSWLLRITETQQRVGAAAAAHRPDAQQQAAPSLRVCECVPGDGRAHMYGVPSFVSAPGVADDGAFCAECRAETQRMKTLLLLLLGEEEVEKEVEEEGDAGEEG